MFPCAPKARVLGGCRTRKEACLRPGSKQVNAFELKDELPFLTRTVHNTLPTCCLPSAMAQLRRGQISVQSTLDVQEGSDAITGEGRIDARIGL